MTELIGVHEIPCLSDTDYAAYALYMQCLAEQVEAQLVANLAQVEEVLHRPIRVWFQTGSIASGGAGQFPPSGIQFSLNYPATFADSVFATLNLRGWWRIGLLLRAVSSAPAVGLGNNRLVSLAAFPPNTPTPLQNFNDGAWLLKLQDVTWETNTGNGQSLYTQADVYNPGDPAAGPYDQGLPLVKALSVEAGGAESVTFTGTYWAIYLGDTPSIDI